MPVRKSASSRDDRGSATVELTLLIPALLLVLGLLVAGGRVWFARTAVVEAAQSAARAASLARSAEQGRADGVDAGEQSLTTARLVCASSTVSVDAAAFAVPVGTPATITATVDCRVSLADLLLPVVPGSLQLTGEGSASLDTYRSR